MITIHFTRRAIAAALLILLATAIAVLTAPSVLAQPLLPALDTAVPPHPLLSDVRVRHALANCTDRDALIQSAYSYVDLTPAQREALRMDTFIPKGHWLYSQPPVEYRYPFDPGQGRQLLDEAGWTLASGATYRTNGAGYQLAVGLSTTGSWERQAWGAALEQQWRDNCGVRLVRSQTAADVFFGWRAGSLQRRDFELAAFAWVGEPHPVGSMAYGCDYIPTAENGWRGQNYMGWCNPTADAALKRSANTLDRDAIKAEYVTVQNEFARDMVSLPLYQRMQRYGVRAALENYQPNPTEYDTWDIHAWRLPEVSTLVILGEEPADLYRFNTSGSFGRLEWLLFEKGVSKLDYWYQPVLLAQLPSTGNGLLQLGTVTANEGSEVVDADGAAVNLKPGVTIRRADGALITYSGGPVQMQQMSVQYEFQPGLRWSDGQPVKQADFALAQRHDCDPDSYSYLESTCAAFAGVATADAGYTVTYKPGYAASSYLLPPFLFYPSHQVIGSGSYQGKTLANVPAVEWYGLPEILERPLGVGPYRVKSWERGKELVFEKNPYYWRGADTLPFQEVKVVFNLSMDEAIQQIEAGALHVLPNMPATSSTDVRIDVIPSATWEHLDLNLNLYRQVVARQVTPAGATVAAEVGIRLILPAGALDSAADVVINDLGAATEEFDDARAAVRAFTLNATDDGGQPVTQFNQPLTLTVTYTDEELRDLGLNEDTVNLAYWDGAAWQALLPCAGCSIDPASNRITVQIDQFSEFAVTASARLYLPSVQSK